LIMNPRKAIIAASLILLLVFVITLCVGRYHLNVRMVGQLFWLRMTGVQPDSLSTDATVLWSVRLPRSIMAAMAGMVLSVSGAVFQGIFRNPLVSPDILGVSSGASFGAGLAIILAGGSALAIELSAFAWALVAVTVAYQIGKRGNSITTLVLAGVIISAVFTAGLSFLKYVADPYEQLPAIVFWTMGGFNKIVWADILRAIPLMTGGITAIWILRWRLNLLAMGDEEAMSLGINASRERRLYIVLATLIVAASISACGSIGWVGLVVPHMARIMVGPDHKILIPFSALIGAIFMLLMDTLARTISGAEIPISIITSLIGAPFLAYLLLKQEKRQWQE